MSSTFLLSGKAMPSPQATQIHYPGCGMGKETALGKQFTEHTPDSNNVTLFCERTPVGLSPRVNEHAYGH